MSEASTTGIALIEICNKLFIAFVQQFEFIFTSFVSNPVNLLIYTSFYWKWPTSCHVLQNCQ